MKNIFWVVECSMFGYVGTYSPSGFGSDDKESAKEDLCRLRKEYPDLHFRLKKYVSA